MTFQEAMKKFWTDVHKEIEPTMETFKEAIELRKQKRKEENNGK